VSERQLQPTDPPVKRGRGRPPKPPGEPKKAQIPAGNERGNGAVCITCASVHRPKIERDWTHGLSYHGLAAKHGISEPALRNHFGAGKREPCQGVSAAMHIARTRMIDAERQRLASPGKTGDVIADRFDALYMAAMQAIEVVAGGLADEDGTRRDASDGGTRGAHEGPADRRR